MTQSRMKGVSKQCPSRRSGVSSIRLAAAADIERVEHDGELVNTIVMRAAAAFADYHFAEGEARYAERVEMNRCGPLVVHTLEFGTRHSGSEERAAVEELARLSCDGMAALVTTCDGTTLLVGYSPRMGMECPLRLVEAVCDSGNGSDDRGGWHIKLQSCDTSPALPLSADIP